MTVGAWKLPRFALELPWIFAQACTKLGQSGQGHGELP